MSRGTKLVISFIAGAGTVAGVSILRDAWRKRKAAKEEIKTIHMEEGAEESE